MRNDNIPLVGTPCGPASNGGTDEGNASTYHSRALAAATEGQRPRGRFDPGADGPTVAGAEPTVSPPGPRPSITWPGNGSEDRFGEDINAVPDMNVVGPT